MRIFCHLLTLFLITFVHAKTTEEAPVFELMSVLNPSELKMHTSQFNIVNAFGDTPLPKGTKLIVDKNFANSPEGFYRVYPVPADSKYEGVNSEKFFKEDPNFKQFYDIYKANIKDGCKPTENNPYSCMPSFFISRDHVGTAPPLELEVAKTAARLNQTVANATIDNCEGCLENAQSGRPVKDAASGGEVKRAPVLTNNESDCFIKLSGEAVNCNSTSKGTKSWLGVQKMVCLYQKSGKNFCPDVATDLKRIEIISDLLGFDRRQLACMTLIESKFNSSACSTAGACGVTQFLSGTANSVASMIRKNYKSEWEEFQRKIGGTPFPVSSVTGPQIRSGHNSYGLFATAVYLRHLLTTASRGRNIEGSWKSHLKSGGDARYLFHSLIAGYNWRPGSGKAMLEHIRRDQEKNNPTNFRNSTFGSTPNETDKYMRDFDSCMYVNGNWKFRGSNPSRARANACKLSRKEPICD